jgi:hypothetical protein
VQAEQEGGEEEVFKNKGLVHTQFVPLMFKVVETHVVQAEAVQTEQ